MSVWFFLFAVFLLRCQLFRCAEINLPLCLLKTHVGLNSNILKVFLRKTFSYLQEKHTVYRLSIEKLTNTINMLALQFAVYVDITSGPVGSRFLSKFLLNLMSFLCILKHVCRYIPRNVLT